MKIGLVGIGSMGHAHASAWRGLGADLVGVTARSDDSAAEFAEQFGVSAYDTFEELLEVVDIVDLCIPTDLHRQFTEQAAAAGKHVICEKPIALTLEDAQAMEAACEGAGVRLFIAQVVRFFPHYRAARDLLASGALGDLGTLTLRRVSSAPMGGKSWFADEARSGGMIFDLMIHDLDYARWLGGPVERVYARSLRGQNPGAGHDYAQVTLRFASGALALVEGGWVLPPGEFRTALDVAGTDGLIEWNSDSGDSVREFLHKPETDEFAGVGLPSLAFARDPFEVELGHALNAIRNDLPFDVSAREATQALDLAISARASLSSGAPVVPELSA